MGFVHALAHSLFSPLKVTGKELKHLKKTSDGAVHVGVNSYFS